MSNVSQTQPTEIRQEDASGAQLMVILGLVAVLFFFGLQITERFGEYFVDVDFKPFFIPLLFIALLPLGKAGKITWFAAIGGAVGEAIGDLIEGYEIDDPFGLVGYILGFAIAGYIIRNRPLRQGRLLIASVVAAAVNAALEAFAFWLFAYIAPDETADPTAALISFAGNTVTHGIILGAVLLMPLVPLLHGRFERNMGFAPLPR